mmetsp:Transcript_20303/g.36258  ORF Transcript_20303/g.36258 Transcript_20303/m.36258 type:complete len:105 (-) Transcript_20303:408-722(-)
MVYSFERHLGGFGGLGRGQSNQKHKEDMGEKGRARPNVSVAMVRTGLFTVNRGVVPDWAHGFHEQISLQYTQFLFLKPERVFVKAYATEVGIECDQSPQPPAAS